MERYFKRKVISTSSDDVVVDVESSTKNKQVDLNSAFQRRKFLETIKLIPNGNEDEKDIVNSYAQQVLKSIREGIRDDVFGLILNETSDGSTMQVVMVLRYVDKCGIVNERFVGLVDVMEKSALSLKSAIESLFAQNGWSLKKVRGQAYCGDGDMRDEFNGLKSLILVENSSAHYVHCFAHRLQLVVLAVVKKHIGVGNFFDMMAVLMNVVYTSCKRKDKIRESNKEKMQEEFGSGKSEIGSGLNQVLSHFETYFSVVTFYPCLLEVLEYVEEEGDNNLSQRQANSLQIYLKSFDFVFYLHLMLQILGITHVSARALLIKDIGILEPLSVANATKQVLQKFRDDRFDTLLEKISSFCEKHDIEKLNLEEDYVNPKNRRQKTSITYRYQYEFNCFNTVVDMLIQEFNDLFNEKSSEVLTCMGALNPRHSFRDFNPSKLLRLSELYPDDFSNAERVTLKKQLDIYIGIVQNDERFANLNDIADLARVMVETRKHYFHPLVYRLVKLALVLPVASTTVERSVSAIDLLKSNLRNRIRDDNLSSGLICAVEKDVLASITNDDVMNHFQKT